MAKNKDKFISLTIVNGCKVTFGDNKKGKVAAKDYNQEEGIDYDETFALIIRLEAIRMLLALAYVTNFKLFQMDMKSAFLNGYIMEEVYVQQSPSFEDNLYLNHVFKLQKTLKEER